MAKDKTSERTVGDLFNVFACVVHKWFYECISNFFCHNIKFTNNIQSTRIYFYLQIVIFDKCQIVIFDKCQIVIFDKCQNVI